MNTASRGLSTTVRDGREDAPSPRSRRKYALKTALDVAKLFKTLDARGREILVADLILIAEAMDRQNPLVKAMTKISSFTWIDDDKGRGDFVLRLQEGGHELLRWQVAGDGASPESGTGPDAVQRQRRDDQ